MQVAVDDTKIQRFLERKFRLSKSHFTKIAYNAALNRFEEFLRVKYNLDVNQLINQITETKSLDPLDVLDEYYTYLSNTKKATAHPLVTLQL